MNDEADFDLTCWYLNKRRILELVGTQGISHDLDLARRRFGPGSHLYELAELASFKNAVSDWLRSNNPPTLGQLLIAGDLREGCVFTLYTNFFCRGSMITWRAIESGKPPPPIEAHAKLDSVAPGMRLECKFHHSHLTSQSAWTELSGQKSLLMLAIVKRINGQMIEALPCVIANPFPQLTASSRKGEYWPSRFEVHVDSIDSFAAIRDIHAKSESEIWLS